MPDDPTQFKTISLHFDESSWNKLAAFAIGRGEMAGRRWFPILSLTSPSQNHPPTNPKSTIR